MEVVDVIIQNDYEIPDPEPGERPVSVRRAAQLTGYSTHVEAPEVITCS